MSGTFLNRAEIEAAQLASLRTLIDALIPDNQFYTERLASGGITTAPASLEEFVSKCPFTTKSECVTDQADHPPYGTNLTYPEERYTRFHQTSGSTGKPMRWLDTNESWDWMLGNWCEVYRAADVTEADRVFFAFSFGPFLGFWTAFESALQIGCLCLPGGGLSSAVRVRNIIEQRATVLCCTPTYALHLAAVAEREGIDLGESSIKTIIVAGEPGGSLPATRKQMEDAWNGARVFDHHGMTEVGPVTYECPDQPGVLHIVETSYLSEIVDPESGAPVDPGETGELILTTLGRTGSPLLRYRTGDLVKAATTTPCKCGRHDLALVGGILGRADDMVVVRGVNIYPGAVDQIIREHGGVAEYQVKVDSANSMTELAITVEPEAHCEDSDSLAKSLARSFQDSLALRVPVSLAERDSLPRFELKAKRWLKVGK
ncbi:MAG: phenylacetate--CoA ligase family protein [Limisphaerales bacterium]